MRRAAARAADASRSTCTQRCAVRTMVGVCGQRGDVGGYVGAVAACGMRRQKRLAAEKALGSKGLNYKRRAALARALANCSSGIEDIL